MVIGKKVLGILSIRIYKLGSQQDWNTATPGNGHSPIVTSKDASEQLSVGS